MNAAEVLKRMTATYGEARTYADKGVVSTLFIHTDEKREMRIPFWTWFVRPSRFRHECLFEDRLTRHIIYGDA